MDLTASWPMEARGKQRLVREKDESVYAACCYMSSAVFCNVE